MSTSIRFPDLPEGDVVEFFHFSLSVWPVEIVQTVRLVEIVGFVMFVENKIKAQGSKFKASWVIK
jgi:hypothetical protein